MSLFFFQTTLLLYLIGTAVYMVAIVSQRPEPAKAAWAALVAGFVSHSLALGGRCLEAGYTPVTNLHESLSFFAWMIVGLYLFFQYRYQVRGLGAFVTPTAAILMVWSWARSASLPSGRARRRSRTLPSRSTNSAYSPP